MPRYRILVEYDGGPYAGWQFQEGQPSVQAAIERAILAFSGEPARITGAGRTDAGVHALGQVAHFDLERPWPATIVRNAVNAKLALAGEAVAILDAQLAEPDFHARFSARARHYLYRILCRHARPALDRGRVWWVPRPLDTAAMQQAAQLLVGRHDFTTFRSAQCQSKSPVRTLDRLDVAHCGELVEIRASARSFLHNQVRSLAGTLKLVGEGRWTPQHVRAALEARDRSACGPVAPAEGLYLVAVDYDCAAASQFWSIRS